MNFFRKASTNYQSLSIGDYHTQYVAAKAPHFLLDVRTTGEFAGGHIPGAVNIPLDQLPARLAEVPTDQPVVVVCQSGNRSRSGADILHRGGLKDLYNLEGGTMRWAMSGFTVER